MLSLSRRGILKSAIAASLFRLLPPSQNPSGSCGGGVTGKLPPSGALRFRTLSSSASSPPGGGGGGWTEEVEYLDEAGEVICSGRGFVRPVDPGRDAHILVGDRPRPISDAAAAAKILEIARRWRWGPEMEAHLGRLHFVPSPRQISRALADLLNPSGIDSGSGTVDTALGLLRWARRQPWYAPDGGAYALLIDRLSAAGDFDGVQALFDGMMADAAGAVDGREEGAIGGGASTGRSASSPFSAAANRAIQHLARAGRLEASFHCFKMVCDHPALGGALEHGLPYRSESVRFSRIATNQGKPDSLDSHATDPHRFPCESVRFMRIQSDQEESDSPNVANLALETPTYNALINLFLSRGLPYKAFEIYESMESSNCAMDAATYDLLVPALARSGRLDAALRLYEAMKSSPGLRPTFSIYASLVDSLGKSGRLDQSLRVYREMQDAGHRPSAAMFGSMIESFIKSGKLDAGVKLWEEMKGAGFRPNFGLYTMVVEAHAKSGRLETAAALFSEMEKAGFLPTPATYASLIEIHSSSGQVDAAMRLHSSMASAGMRPGLNTYTALLSVLANKKLLDVAGKILLEMKASGFSVDVHASDVLMVYVRDGSTNLALRWLQFMGSVGIRTNNFIVRQLFESCMRTGLYESAKPLLETYVGSAAKVDLILYTSILAHLVRCKDEAKERQLMGILSTTEHKAHAFMCGLFVGPEQRGKPVLAFVREFFQGMDYELEEGAARYFVNVLLNYLVLMGQMNRARCVWKVAYENKLFPKAIVFDHNIAWSLDVRSLSVGAALVAVVHTLHRFRKRMLYYGVLPRRIKLVTGPTLKMVIAQVLASVESPFEVSKVVLRAPGDSVLEWFKKPIVQQFLLNEIPTKADVLMHRLNVMFPSSAPEVLDFCNASAKEYTCIFTSGATAALKLIGEAFPWSEESCFMYTMENHNSVLGIREYALHCGASALAVDIEDIKLHNGLSGCYDSVEVSKHSVLRRAAVKSPGGSLNGNVFNLFAFPLECNFSGRKFHLDLVKIIKENAGRILEDETNLHGRWMVLIDAAKGCATKPPDLTRFPADFVALSFYKIFGFPTGLGALIVRNEAARLLRKSYFSGGTVLASIANIDFVKRRECIEQLFEDGTLSFLSIASLRHGFKIINTLTVSAIARHTASLATYVSNMLVALKHGNGAEVCILYGRECAKISSIGWGPTIAFNLKRPDGSWFGHREVEKLASLSGIQLRTGCFCNPGACAKYLGLSQLDLISNFEAGHVCWDDYDILHGKPTGAIRISFGYMSVFEDARNFLRFIEGSFVFKEISIDEEYSSTTKVFPHGDISQKCTTGGIRLKSITVYPIKSCAGFSVDSWPLSHTGLRYDREWLLRAPNGEILTQKKVLEMSKVYASIDLRQGMLILDSPKCKEKLQIPIEHNFVQDMTEELDVYGQRYEVKEYDNGVNEWFCRALARPCILVRCYDLKYQHWRDNGCKRSMCRDIKSKTNFVNEAQLLLISLDSINDLNSRLRMKYIQGSDHGPDQVENVNPMRFRPNLVVSGSKPYAEDNWGHLNIDKAHFTSLGGCNRCQMINLDPLSPQVQKSREPLATLASFRRVHGKILFGILLRYERRMEETGDTEIWLQVGQEVCPDKE